MLDPTLTALQRVTANTILKMSDSRHPITGKEIANRIGLKERQKGMEGADMRSIIHALRLKGYPICASGRGYWYAKSEVELQAFIVSLQARSDSIVEAIEGLKKAGNKVRENLPEWKKMMEEKQAKLALSWKSVRGYENGSWWKRARVSALVVIENPSTKPLQAASQTGQ